MILIILPSLLSLVYQLGRWTSIHSCTFKNYLKFILPNQLKNATTTYSVEQKYSSIVCEIRQQKSKFYYLMYSAKGKQQIGRHGLFYPI